MEQITDIEMQLWEYLDGTCTDADNRHISLLISEDTLWQEKFNELSAFHSELGTKLELEQPSLRFSKNVMEAVSHLKIATPTKKYINYNIIRGIAAFFVIAIVTALGYAFATTNWTSSKPDEITKLYPRTNFNFTNLFTGDIFNVIVGINIVLGLLLVDTWLRRRKAFSN
jgi:hypothetical protein